MPTENDSGENDSGIVYTASFFSQATQYFPDKSCRKELMLLSIEGNEKCAGEHLTAMVKQAVANHQRKAGIKYSKNIEKTTILIADEIFWHNLRQNSSDDEAMLKAKALAKGEVFFETNLDSFLAPFNMKSADFNEKYPDKTVDEKIQIINELAFMGMTNIEFDEKYPGITADERIKLISELALTNGKNFEIMRWSTWIKQNGFEDRLKEILPRYNEIPVLKDSIANTAKDFVKRHTGQGTDDAILTLRSTGYLTEESPSIMMLAAELGYNFIIYPGPMLPSFEATKNWFIGTTEKETIVEGKASTPECTHDKLVIHVDNPALLVNWMKVNFNKTKPGSSLSNKTPAPLRIEEKKPVVISASVESVVTPLQVSVMNGPVQHSQREAKEGTPFFSPKSTVSTFFSPEKTRKVATENLEALKVLANAILNSGLPLEQKGYLLSNLYRDTLAPSMELRQPVIPVALS